MSKRPRARGEVLREDRRPLKARRYHYGRVVGRLRRIAAADRSAGRDATKPRIDSARYARHVVDAARPKEIRSIAATLNPRDAG
jgi:hypothetical protein